MTNYKLALLCEDDTSYLTLVKEKQKFNDTYKKPNYNDLTLKKIANALDQDAENVNAHDFVECHTRLTELLVKTIGIKATEKVLSKLVKTRGLHGLNGLRSCRD